MTDSYGIHWVCMSFSFHGYYYSSINSPRKQEKTNSQTRTRRGRGGNQLPDKDEEGKRGKRVVCYVCFKITPLSVASAKTLEIFFTRHDTCTSFNICLGGPLLAVKISRIALLGQLYQLLSCCDGPTIGFTSPRKSTVVPPRNAASTLPPSLPSSPPLN